MMMIMTLSTKISIKTVLTTNKSPVQDKIVNEYRKHSTSNLIFIYDKLLNTEHVLDTCIIRSGWITGII